MRSTKQLINENNEKRKLLNAENELLYEDFSLYIRTDLRVAEHESEELLMDLLDHLLEGQEDGKTATNLFGSHPRKYADELIAGLPHEKKRNVIPYVFSLVFNLLGWFSLIYGMVNLVLLKFTKVDETISLGNSIVLLTVIMIVTAFGVFVIFKLIRSTLFVNKKQRRRAFWKAGFFGAGSFALIMFLTRIMPDFGPEVNFEWWVYLVIGAVLVIISKLVRSITT
ncbi:MULTISPECIES: DUF1129 family protein [Niallia]|uniref:DUF1129 family protein n=1 Tax=Niallia alba TaxID=2729105 RepID=A0A7Y0KCG3_9BACI|nr:MULTISPECIES: DUF1129 family protein [Niallia]EOR21780.1 hypothetical protein A499_21315 [Niallia nealsonii AAU1]NMO79720.1 DUF1129 family protein [Niallia alba]UTI42977.1 DUF1129 domain-containing protein [Niallia sp. RD1]